MLVLSRRENEKVLFPHLGITVQVLRLSGNQVRLGVNAPKHVRVLRDELSDPAAFIPPPNDLGNRLQTRIHAAAEELCRLHEELENNNSDDAEARIYRVFFELKALEEEVLAHGGAASPERSLERRRRALVVDDNNNESRLLAGFLRCRDFDVEIASDGAAAMQHLAHHELPDCVLLDMNMPQYDGRWTINKIRENPKYRELQVFAVSGMHPAEYGVDIGPAGINRWFRKPLDPEALVLQMDQFQTDPESPAPAA